MFDTDNRTIGAPRRPRGETRTVLLDACTELVRAEGPAAVTTERMAREAGISQPGFYNHFKNTDELLRTAVVAVLQDMAARQLATWREHNASVDPQRLLSAAHVHTQLDLMIPVFTSEPRFADLYLRYRLDPTVLDGAIKRVADEVREDLTAEVWSIAQRFGGKPADYPRVAFYAELLLGLYYRACEMIIAERFSYSQVLDLTTTAVSSLRI